MTVGAILSEVGASVEVREPIFSTVEAEPQKFDITEQLTSLSMSKQARGGDWDANFSLLLRIDDAEDWFLNGLGRHITIYNSGSRRRWAGFVDSVGVNVGEFSVESGSLLDIGNRVLSTYTPIYYDVYPPVKGSTTETTIAQSTVSQRRYGIFDKIVQAGTCPDADATQIRDLFLAENAWAKTSSSLSLNAGKGSYGQVSLNCLGYIHMLKAYIRNITTTGVVDIATRIGDTVAADPNGAILLDNRVQISANPYLIPATDRNNRFAFDQVSSLTNLGDALDNQYVWGVGPDRIFYYKPMPSSVAYEHHLTDERQRIIDLQSRESLVPWDIDPGKWLVVPDFLSGLVVAPTASFSSDPRYVFLERVTYTAPYELSLSGSRFDKLSAALAKITMSGGY